MKFLTISITILLLTLSALGKEFRLKGQLIDSLSNTPVPYTSIQISNTDNEPILSWVIMTDDATFDMGNIKLEKSHYNILFSCPRYQNKVIQLDTENASAEIDLGQIKLKPTVLAIDAVTVVGQARTRQEVDRAIYLVDSMRLTGVSVATDLLGKIPEISIDEVLRKAKIKGKENTLVIVNGINSETSVDLRTIDFRDIERIEVVTLPASGTEIQYDGIINIITKAKVRNGFSIDLEETLKVDGRSNDIYLGLMWGGGGATNYG